MRLISILTALLVMASLYLLVFERPALLDFAGAAEVPIDVETAPQDGRAGAVPVVAVTSQAQQIDSAVRLRGRTEAARQVDVRAETSGRIVSDPLRKGSFVEEGQLLCRLDPGTREVTLTEAQARLAEARARAPEARARVAEAEARLSEARIEQNAAQKLSEGGFASDTRVASANAAVESALAAIEAARSGLTSAAAGEQAAQAVVAAAEKEIERLEIRAPFGGLLESDTAELGELMQPGSLCATIVQLDPIKLVGFVPETDVDKVAPGSPAGGRLASGQQVQGIVSFLSRAADEQTRTFRTEVEVANADLAIRDGQTAEILIASDGRTAHLLPQSALTLDDTGDLGVRTVDDGTALFTPVQLLRDSPEGVWITGLDDFATVIVVGQEYVTDGTSVDVTLRERAQ
ncbi:efflux transporter, RND family, MFP subunit [Oceaniovalibus guishaninsula JLT2003]|uniref:Efflux transporter, RND family, MFP subunit n=1 Tax=Oceaniovalibus guishaninsula JLT2003 TaxID=1231392 RepID=K2GLB0_9RHOB|nr:efflux RND transporter periplasmic adaptor subunit [Oceaniovalibus guishaninsula]EKE43546.1 efflux transporter, RND family, MFP subunit [Oceaniovalibus guishaninsula JLT2003]